MKPHGNSYQNTESHHLYVIFDGNDDSIYKFGISDDTIDAEGLSSRIKEQLDVFNRIAGSFRFYARILHRDIPGRRAARVLESQHIQEYRAQFGQRPPGNLRD